MTAWLHLAKTCQRISLPACAGTSCALLLRVASLQYIISHMSHISWLRNERAWRSGSQPSPDIHRFDMRVCGRRVTAPLPYALSLGIFVLHAASPPLSSPAHAAWCRISAARTCCAGSLLCPSSRLSPPLQPPYLPESGRGGVSGGRHCFFGAMAFSSAFWQHARQHTLWYRRYVCLRMPGVNGGVSGATLAKLFCLRVCPCCLLPASWIQRFVSRAGI
jgi:hypothetical protein